MRSNLIGRQLLLAIVPVALGLGCSQRSGLDRGDANGDVLRRSAPNAAEEVTPRTAEDDSPSSNDTGRFAAAPADAADEPATPMAPPATPPRRAESGGDTAFERSAAAKPAARDKSYAASESSSADLSARGGTAYRSKSRDRDVFQPKKERRGLGTSWGESRDSRVTSVDFERDNPHAPTATQRIFYNDVNGILAQTGERSQSAFTPNQTDLGRGFVTVEIVDPGGFPLPGLTNGNQSFVVGRDGDRYSIRVRNHERHRVEVVATVDGLDVIDGTKGHLQKRGYVVDPYSTLLIEGFRKSASSVASFRFGAVSDSYAARTGSDRNVGVIGIALFGERGCCIDETTQRELRRRETADPFPGQFARPPMMRPSDH